MRSYRETARSSPSKGPDDQCTPRRQHRRWHRACRRALGLALPEVLQGAGRFLFGTTHAMDALVQHKAAKTALLVTEGFS
jgi:N-methylhydantoinase A/oxoprolinase/acetone carboxylase beta subunit